MVLRTIQTACGFSKYAQKLFHFDYLNTQPGLCDGLYQGIFGMVSSVNYSISVRHDISDSYILE